MASPAAEPSRPTERGDCSGPSPAAKARLESIPPRPRIGASYCSGQVAQLVEQWTENPCVAGSIPALPIGRLALRSILLLLLTTPAALAQADAKELVEKAIRAHGGDAALSKLNSVRITVEGEGEFAPGQPPVPIVVEDVWRMPDRYKTTSRLTLQGQKVTQTLCINGEEGWAAVNGQVQPLPPGGFKEMKEQKWAEDFDRLLPLRDKSLKLTRIADTKVDDHPAAGIRVEVEGHREVRLYFDNKSGLLVKRAQEVMGETGKPVVQSVVFPDFADKDGVKHWTRIAAYHDGKPFISCTLKEIQIGVKLDPGEFARPK